jgi:GT2 family glycosyltransferase
VEDSNRVPGALGRVAEHIRLSVIIINWNTRDMLRDCLKSQQSYIDDEQYEFIVVDNGSSDGSVAMVQSEFPKVHVVALEKNIGFTGGNNAGLAVAGGKYLLLLNSDTEVVGDALGTMCDYLDEHPAVGAVGAKLISPDGSTQESCRRFPSHKTALFNRKSLLTKYFPGNRYSKAYLMTDEERSTTREVDWVMGAALMTRRTVIEQIGPLDPTFFIYAEDVDWCLRMHRAGWKIVYLPAAEILHHYEVTIRAVPFKMNLERHKSMWHYYKKHHRGGPLLDALTLGGIAVRMTTLASRDALLQVTRKMRRQK